MILSDRLARRLKAAGTLLPISVAWVAAGQTQETAAPRFKVIAFYTGTSDLAHVSFVREANRWFPETARTHNFTYESTTDWTNLNVEFLARLGDRPR